MKTFLNMMSVILAGQTRTEADPLAGFKKESPEVQKRREAALRKMNEMGRATLLEGGDFSLHNKALRRNYQLSMFGNNN